MLEPHNRHIIKTLDKMQGQMTAMQEQLKDGFAAQAERHNDLMIRVVKLECNGQS